jgi:hypothetical protein
LKRIPKSAKVPDALIIGQYKNKNKQVVIGI